jgi:hypothetical protein
VPVTLKNKARAMKVFNLPHAIVCTEALCLCTRRVTGVQDVHRETGEKQMRALKKRLADSITFTAAGTEGDTIKELPDTVLQVPEIGAAIRRRELAIVTAQAAPAAEEAAAEPPPEDEKTIESKPDAQSAKVEG